jgi:hypothetical protein
MQTTQTVIARLESGRGKPPTRTLERFAEATGSRLRINLEPVLGGRGWCVARGIAPYGLLTNPLGVPGGSRAHCCARELVLLRQHPKVKNRWSVRELPR